jgi:ribosomal protein S14
MRATHIREVKDYKVRYRNFPSEDRFVPLRAIIRNQQIRSEFRVLARYLLYKNSLKYKFPNNFRNRCLITGRVRAVLPYFKLSRIEFRQLAKQNYFMGVKKSSWLVVIFES